MKKQKLYLQAQRNIAKRFAKLALDREIPVCPGTDSYEKKIVNLEIKLFVKEAGFIHTVPKGTLRNLGNTYHSKWKKLKSPKRIAGTFYAGYLNKILLLPALYFTPPLRVGDFCSGHLPGSPVVGFAGKMIFSRDAFAGSSHAM